MRTHRQHPLRSAAALATALVCAAQHAGATGGQITWGTYLGGSEVEHLHRIAFAPDGNLVVAGSTQSADFPTTGGAYLASDPDGVLGWDGYVAVFDPTGSTLLACTYLGGDDDDGINGLAVHADGRITVVGHTKSTDFPAPTAGALQSSKGVGWDGFVVTLDAALSTIDYATYLGDPNAAGSRDWACSVAVDAAGLVTVAGYTQSNGFPATPGAYQETKSGLIDAFVTRLDPSQSGAAQVIWSTFLGGTFDEGIAGVVPPEPNATITLDLHLDPFGVVTLSGRTESSDFPVVGGYQGTLGGVSDVFVARLDPSATGAAQLVWSTLLGGSGPEFPTALAVEPSGCVTVAGSTLSPSDFPTTAGAYQLTFAGGSRDAFVARLDPAQAGAAQLVWSTLLGGATDESALGLGVNAAGEAVVCGWTDSTGFPTTPNAYAPTFGGGGLDAWIARLDPGESGAGQLQYSSFFGASGLDRFGTLTLDAHGAPQVGGSVNSVGLATPGAYETLEQGALDAFLARYEFPAEAGAYCTAGTSASGCRAALFATGAPSATAAGGFTLYATSVEGAKDGLYFFGTSGRQANAWGNGTSLQCVVPPVKRAGLMSGVGSAGACDGSFARDLNALWCPTCPKPGHNPGAGATVQAQLWYRDPGNTSNQTTSLSDAIEFVVGL